MRYFYNTVLTIIWVALFTVTAFSETIRGPIIDHIVIEGEAGYRKQAEVKAGGLIFVSLGENKRFLKGLQLQINMSDLLKRYSDCFALELYHSISPDPDTGIVEFSGKRVFFNVLPVLNKLYVIIPVGENGGNSGYRQPDKFVLSVPIPFDRFPILISIQPVAKGVPDSVLEKDFYFNIEPELDKKGILELSIKKPAGLESRLYDIYIDDVLLDGTQNSYIFPEGLHSLKVRSETFTEENTSFSIEAGKTTRIEIILKRSKPILIVDAIEGASLFLDGEKLNITSGEEMAIEEGPHTILIKIGSQTITKKIDVISGKRYIISLIFDIIIKEN
ncbi:MAG: hypothetical protein JW881_11535 [Spirochaetales bacterium]|nr:hypothetical protein [Spirochaetales bacterium]